MSELPRSLEAERATIGAVLLDGRAFTRVADVVTTADFYHPPNAAIFEAMTTLDARGTAIDAVSTWAQLVEMGRDHMLRAQGGPSYFAQLTEAVVTSDNARHYAQIVAGKASARRLVETCSRIAAKGLGDYGDLREYLDESERALFSATMQRTATSREAFKPIAKRVIESVERRSAANCAVTGVPSGYPDLDAITAGFQPSDLIIAAGRPSMGKTSLAMNAVVNAVIAKAGPALVFTLEMSKEALVERAIACEARVDAGRLRTGFLDTRDWIAMAKAVPRIVAGSLEIDDTGAPTVMEIRAKARRWRMDHPTGMGIVVVDYLQLIRSERRKGGNREQEVSEISRALKLLAKEIVCPVVALSQLSRALESRADKRPIMSDLRESGAIEQDADLILFLYRDEVYHPETEDKGIAEVIVGKQRNGSVGTVYLRFMNEFTRFEHSDHTPREGARKHANGSGRKSHHEPESDA